MSKNKNKLTFYNRLNLQVSIEKGESMKKITSILRCDRSTIYREITNHVVYKQCRKTCNHCIKMIDKSCNHICHINGHECNDFEPIHCIKWKKFPYACNGCENRKNCYHLKRYYDFQQAHKAVRKLRKESRTKLKASGEDLNTLNQVISRGLKMGQSIHHCYVANPEIQKICSERTIRRMIDNNCFNCTNADLPRFSRYNHVKRYKYLHGTNKIERLYLRTFDLYLTFKEKNPSLNYWQYDSVEGKTSDKKAILTLTNPETRFQFGILINKSSPQSVMNALKDLHDKLGDEYANIFQVNLADNGIEFDKFNEIEKFINDCYVPKVFYTTPYRSTDKAACERNHEFIRYVIPKHVSLDFLTQDKVNLLFSHINSYVRSSNKNQTPYELIKKKFGVKFLDQIGIKNVRPKDVRLRPDLIR